jgi:hypothetical protein
LLAAASASAFVSGLCAGLIGYLDRSPVREHHSADTSAWGVHIGLFVLAAALTLVGLRRLRDARARAGRSGEPGPLGPLAMIGARAGIRLKATLRAGQVSRILLAAALVLLIAYGWFRAGMQVLGGLDPNFTANAWGGPSYPGAMFCHYLDGGLIMAACAKLLNWIMIPSSETR